jgi:hypothetical protein
MKKTGKSGLERLKKAETMNHRTARGRLRLALAAAAESEKAERRARRRCAWSVCSLNRRHSGRDGAGCSIPHFCWNRRRAIASKAFRKTGPDSFESSRILGSSRGFSLVTYTRR